MTAQARPKSLTHLERLEAESIHILREVAAEAERPVMLYGAGKDSAVMLHLARKAFHPSPPPFLLLHVDTTWEFKAMYALRDRMARESGMELLVYRNPEAEARGINPFDHGALHTDMWKTEGLRQAIMPRSRPRSGSTASTPCRSPASRATTSPRALPTCFGMTGRH